jgi:hypothetical protein
MKLRRKAKTRVKVLAELLKTRRLLNLLSIKAICSQLKNAMMNEMIMNYHLFQTNYIT